MLLTEFRNLFCNFFKMKFMIFFLIFMGIFFKNILGGRLMKIDDSTSDMKAIKSEKSEDLSRDGLVEILHKGQFFQDIISQHTAPLEFHFGHVYENPNEWEQRFEKTDVKNNRFQGKVRWGTINGEYGEHYWDLNH